MEELADLIDDMKWIYIAVHAAAGVAALVLQGVSYLNGRDSIYVAGVFYFRLSLMMTIVYAILCCCSIALNSDLDLTRAHLTIFLIVLDYLMALNLFISSCMVLATFNTKKLFDMFEMEIYDYPALYTGCGAVGIILSLLLLAFAVWLTIFAVKLILDSEYSD